MTRKSTLSPESAALIAHIKANGTCTVVALRPHFADFNRPQLLKRLGNLVDLGWLDFTWSDAGDKTWFIRPSARAIPVHTVQTLPTLPTAQPAAPTESTASTTPCAAEPAPPIAGPRRVNVMAGTYLPPAGPALRAGALDFQRVGSVGSRC